MAEKFGLRGTIPVVVAAVLASAVATRAQAGQWSTGLGSGLVGLNIEGDMGFGTVLGPIAADDIDLNTSDLADVTKSAAGLAGFSTNGVWTIYYSGQQMKLEDSGNGTTAGGAPVGVGIKFKAVKGELAVGYNFVRTERSVWGVLFGADYTKHDYDSVLSIGAATVTRAIRNDWTDGLIGLTNSFSFAPKWAWASRIDAGFGGSDGTYHAHTEINWDAGRPGAWIFSLFADYKKIDFENDAPGDLDWYRYHVAEFGPGLGFAYIFGGSSAETVASIPPPPPPAAPPPPPPPPAPLPPPPDIDRDGVTDASDQCPNTVIGDRVDAVGCGFNIRLQVLFDTNSAALKPESNADLDRAVDLLRRVPTMRGTIEGHTDAQGPHAYNVALSDRRARSVADYLIDHGIDKARIQWQGYGEEQPVADNTTADGRAQNRRVVLHRSDTGT